MCECGCGEFEAHKAVLVGDNVIAFEIYQGCDSCDTGIIFTAHIFTKEEAEHWLINTSDLKQFKPDEFGHAQIDFPLIGKDDVVKWAKEHEIDENGNTIEDYMSLEDYLEDRGLEMLQGGLRNRLAETGNGAQE